MVVLEDREGLLVVVAVAVVEGDDDVAAPAHAAGDREIVRTDHVEVALQEAHLHVELVFGRAEDAAVEDRLLGVADAVVVDDEHAMTERDAPGDDVPTQQLECAQRDIDLGHYI